MHHRLSLTWIPLLTALLAGPLAEPVPKELWSVTEARLRGIESSSAVDCPLPVARFQKALHPRSPGDRQVGQFWSIDPARRESRIPDPTLQALVLKADIGPLTDSARHFPLFPTGPPSHS